MLIGDLTSTDVRQFAEIVASLQQMRAANEFKPILISISKLLRADFAASYSWIDRDQGYGHCFDWNMSPDHVKRYEGWFQHRDSVTSRLRQRRLAAVSQVIPRPEFERTEIFNDFLRRDGLHFGVNLFVTDGERVLRDLRLWRGKRGEDFSHRDLALLEVLDTFLRQAFARVSETAALPGLTPREEEVASLVACGRTNRQIADALGISLPTVRSHVSACLDKQGLANRAELAATLVRASRH